MRDQTLKVTQMHRGFRGAGKIPDPWTREDQRIQKRISPEG